MDCGALVVTAVGRTLSSPSRKRRRRHHAGTGVWLFLHRCLHAYFSAPPISVYSSSPASLFATRYRDSSLEEPPQCGAASQNCIGKLCSCIFNKRRCLLLLLDEPLGGKCPVSHRDGLFTVTGSEEGRPCLYTDELTDLILLLWRVLKNAKGQKGPTRRQKQTNHNNKQCFYPQFFKNESRQLTSKKKKLLHPRQYDKTCLDFLTSSSSLTSSKSHRLLFFRMVS